MASKLVCLKFDLFECFLKKEKGCDEVDEGLLVLIWLRPTLPCLAYKLNLAYKILYASEKSLWLVYGYFVHSPKKQEEFHELEQLMKTKELKILKNVTSLLHCAEFWQSIVA